MEPLSLLCRRGGLAACIMLTACATAGPSGAAATETSDNAYGAFLAARYADAQNDPSAATNFYLQALRADPGNQALVAQGFLSALLAGSPHASALAAEVPDNALAEMLRGNEAAQQGSFGRANRIFGQLPQDDLAGLIKPLLLAWTQYGRGDEPGALAGLNAYSNVGPFAPVYVLNAALIADAAHDDAAAGPLYAAAAGQPVNLRLAQILASWAARHGAAAQAETQLANLTAAHPDLQIALPGLQAQISKPVIDTPTEGLAEAYLTLAGSLDQPSQTFLRTTLLRFALALRPDLTAARLLLASSQSAGEGPRGPTPLELRNALATLQPVQPSDASYGPAALQEANIYASLNEPDQAVALINGLIAASPQDPGLEANLGDIERGAGNNAAAVAAYDKALAEAGQPTPPGAWSLYFDRGICEDEAGDWAAAQPDMEKALSLAPNEPYVLNYLGYSWALRGENLGQAQALLQRAVGLDPNDGAVIDSLGYVKMRRGDTKAAVTLLTQAVELDPDDAEVNGHLGDAFWQAGLALQADYQWQRALALHPDAKLRTELTGDLQRHFAPPA
jgi:Flp pilus assembly protein TadD